RELRDTAPERGRVIPFGVRWATDVLTATRHQAYGDGAPGYFNSAEQALGFPDHWSRRLWNMSSSIDNDQLAYHPRASGRLVVDFGGVVRARSVVVVETRRPGLVTRLDAIDEDGRHRVLWSGALAPSSEDKGEVTRFVMAQPEPVHRLAVYFGVETGFGYTIDGVGLEVAAEPANQAISVNPAPIAPPAATTWADRLFELSLLGAHARSLGQPHRPRSPRDGMPGGKLWWPVQEFGFRGEAVLVATYERPVLAGEVVIVEKESPGSIRRVEDHSTWPPVLLWEGTYPVDGAEQWLAIPVEPPRRVTDLRVVFDLSAIDDHPAIDGVGVLAPARETAGPPRHRLAVRPGPEPVGTGLAWARRVVTSTAPLGETRAALGPPRVYPAPGGDAARVWTLDAPATATFAFAQAQLARRVVLLQTKAKGAVRRIENFTGDRAQVLWQSTSPTAHTSQQLDLTLDPPQRIGRLRVVADAGVALDAIALEPADISPSASRAYADVAVIEGPQAVIPDTRWANRVIDVSHWRGVQGRGHLILPALSRARSQRPLWGPWQLLGPPDLYPGRGDDRMWRGGDDGHAFVTVGFVRPVWTDTVVIVEPHPDSTVTRVEDHTAGHAELLWQGSYAAEKGHHVHLKLAAPRAIDRLRVIVDEREESAGIDAIGLLPSAAPRPPRPRPKSRTTVTVWPEGRDAPVPGRVAQDLTWGRAASATTEGAPSLLDNGAALRRRGNGSGFDRGWALPRDDGLHEVRVEFGRTLRASRFVIVEGRRPGAIARLERVGQNGERSVIWDGTYPRRAKAQWLEVKLAEPVSLDELAAVADTVRVGGRAHVFAVGVGR
ncbi:MAG: hypothetical protein AAF928_20665, partial [Myxococcota bacterium]